MRGLSIAFGVVVGAVTLLGTAHAQQAVITVSSGVRVIDPPPLRFAYNRDLVVGVSGQAQQLRALRVRVIEGTKASLIRRRPGSDGCVEFVGVLFPISPGPGGVFVTRLGSGWLRGNGEDKRYVLVFEESGADDDLVRIAAADVDAYFANAIDVVVERADYDGPPVVASFASTPVRGRPVGTSGNQSPGGPVGSLPPPRPCTRVQTGVLSVRVMAGEPCREERRKHWLKRLFAS